jgi:hypothetical protein
MSLRATLSTCSNTLPWRGRVGEHRAKRDARRGGVNLANNNKDHPTPPLATLVATLPLQGRVGPTRRTDGAAA